MTDYFKHLPHVLPRNHQEATYRLGLMLGIPLAFLVNANETLLNTLSGVILYRHLNHLEKQGVMRSIHALRNRELKGRLVTKVTDIIVNPTWGIWSLTNAELKQKKYWHTSFDKWASIIGFSAPGAIGAGEFLMKVRTTNALSMSTKAGLVATVLIWGAILYNKSELNRVEEEIQRRTMPMNGSPYYD